jgi:hypothetical protein
MIRRWKMDVDFDVDVDVDVEGRKGRNPGCMR